MSDRLNLIDTIAKQDKFSTFTSLMASSGTNASFDGGKDFTVFVPANDAFAKIPEARMNELLNETNQTALKSLLSTHILPGKVMAANLGSEPTRKAITGEELTFSDSNGLKVNGASVHARNIEATNGVVHGIDTVLAPKTAARAAAAVTAPLTNAGVLPPIVATQSPTTSMASPTATSPTPPTTQDPAPGTPARAGIKSIL